jgi:WD40 repeat protein
MPREVLGYELLGLLGRGGMGVVYQARQLKLGRLVALKMILPGAGVDPSELARFRTEAEAIARLQHPHIVQVFEVGECHGLPFFSLEFCAGGSLDKKLAGTPLPAGAAAELVESLAGAVAAAHRAKVIHRDLKPANVLLTADGTPKITDFGLARKLDVEEGHTRTGAIMGTPSYMAPEQAGGRSKEVGPAADVYALGAILYECLTGRPPFQAATPLDTLLLVVGEEPVPPRRLNPKVPRDLETVCLKCLRKEPRRRYATAAAMAKDLRRFQEGRPVAARPVGRLERLAKWARRRPAAAALVAVSVLAGLTLLLGGVSFTRSLQLERDATRNQWDRARRTAMTAQLLRVAAVCEQNPWLGRELLEDAETCPPELRDFVWGYYYRLCRRDDRILARRTGTPMIYEWATSADGQSVALRGVRDVSILDARTGIVRRTLPFPLTERTHPAFAPDGTLLAVRADWRKGADGKVLSAVHLWDVAAGKPLAAYEGHTGRITSCTFSPDGKTLAVVSEEFDKHRNQVYGGIKLWDVASREGATPLREISGRIAGLAFRPDGWALACIDRGGGPRAAPVLRFLDTKTGEERCSPLGPDFSPTGHVQFSPDGKTLAVTSRFAVNLWDMPEGRLAGTLHGLPEGVRALAFRADGKILAAASGGGVKRWDLATYKPLADVRARGETADAVGFVHGVAFNRDGNLVTNTHFLDAAGPFQSAEVRLWDTNSATGPASRRLDTGNAGAVSVSPDGRTLATADGPIVHVWDTATGKKIATFSGPADRPVRLVRFTLDGRALLRITREGQGAVVKTWDVATQKELGSQTIAGLGFDGKTALSRDGHVLAAGDSDGQRPGGLYVADLPSGEMRLNTTQSFQTVQATALALTEDGGILASGDAGGRIDLWDPRSESRRLIAPANSGLARPVVALALAPDGKTLASGYSDGLIELWDSSTPHRVAIVRGHAAAVHSLTFSPDGKTLASGSADSTIRVWETVTGQLRATLAGHDGEVLEVAFSADGQTLASAGTDRCVRLWEAVFPKR